MQAQAWGILCFSIRLKYKFQGKRKKSGIVYEYNGKSFQRQVQEPEYFPLGIRVTTKFSTYMKRERKDRQLEKIPIFQTQVFV